MQPRAGLFAAVSILVIAGTVTAAAAEMDASKCAGNKQWQDSYNKGNTSAVAALYASDAVEVIPTGILVGPAAVKKYLDDGFKEGWKRDLVTVATKCVLIPGEVARESGMMSPANPI
jgi:ketosteroid isomerase-like protein